MKTVFTILIALLVFEAPIIAHEIELHVVDDNGDPIAGAEALISFMRSGNGDSKVYTGVTGADGKFSASDRIIIGAFVKVIKPGFYDSVIRSGFGAQDHSREIILRRIENPIPLVVREIEAAVPDTDKIVGFDFVVGDWLPPFGGGAVADIEVQFTNSMNGFDYTGKKLEKVLAMSKRAATARNEEWTETDFNRRVGRWDATLEITFPTFDGGVIELQESFVPYSGLTMPHEASESGYEANLEIESSTYDSSKISYTQTPMFLRTRVEKRGEEIVSANYVKLPGGIAVDARGSVKFQYYFNPDANDRNLEFDPQKNVADDQDKLFPP